LWFCQVTPPKDATDPPDLKTAKDKGDQTQLDVSPVQVLQSLPSLLTGTMCAASTTSGGASHRKQRLSP